MHKIIYSFLIFLLSFSCSKDKTPENLIPSDKLAEILSELHVIEAKANRIGKTAYLKMKEYKKLEEEFLTKYQIDTLQLRVSLDYYSTTGKEGVKLYTKVEKLLKSRKDSLTKIQDKKTANKSQKETK